MSVVDKFKNILGLSEEDDDLYNEEFEDEAEPEIEEVEDDFARYGKNKKGKIIKINTTTSLNVVVMQIESFEEARDVADHVKTKRPVVVNLEKLDTAVARRVVDFLSGTSYSLDGNIQKISNGIFLVAPYNVGIMGDFKDELRSKSLF
jgi:cell division inhibitor SepF